VINIYFNKKIKIDWDIEFLLEIQYSQLTLWVFNLKLKTHKN
jgi:hypothetical protein